MAAYNTGPGRLRKAMRKQGLNDYWRLKLVNEAERYVPRIVIISEIMGNPAKYGFRFTKTEFKARAPQELVRLKTPKVAVAVLDLAKEAGIDLRVLRLMNPELGTKYLPQGKRFVLAVPKGKGPKAKSWIEREVKKQVRIAKRRAKKLKARKNVGGGIAFVPVRLMVNREAVFSHVGPITDLEWAQAKRVC